MDKKKIQIEYKEKIKLLKSYNKFYFENSKSAVSDDMYDELKQGFSHLFLQPLYDEAQTTEWNGISFHSTFEKVRSNPEWRLSLQTHKWLGVE